MAQYIDKDKVIEYVKQRLIPIVTNGNTDDWERGANNERINFLSYINSLPEEPVSDYLEEAMELSVSEEPLLEFFATGQPTIGAYNKDSLRNQFEAGAEWQKQQMMKDAVDAFVNTYENSDNSNYVEFVTEQSPYKFKETEKCKLIIIKEEQQ